MKTNRLFFVIAVYSFSFCVMGQMKIQNDGQISIGGYGFCFSSSEGDVVLYDNANYGSMIQFLNVDVIGYFYSPSDSRFKKNIQPLNNTLSGLLRLSGISFS